MKLQDILSIKFTVFKNKLLKKILGIYANKIKLIAKNNQKKIITNNSFFYQVIYTTQKVD